MSTTSFTKNVFINCCTYLYLRNIYHWVGSVIFTYWTPCLWVFGNVPPSTYWPLAGAPPAVYPESSTQQNRLYQMSKYIFIVSYLIKYARTSWAYSSIYLWKPRRHNRRAWKKITLYLMVIVAKRNDVEQRISLQTSHLVRQLKQILKYADSAYCPYFH